MKKGMPAQVGRLAMTSPFISFLLFISVGLNLFCVSACGSSCNSTDSNGATSRDARERIQTQVRSLFLSFPFLSTLTFCLDKRRSTRPIQLLADVPIGSSVDSARRSQSSSKEKMQRERERREDTQSDRQKESGQRERESAHKKDLVYLIRAFLFIPQVYLRDDRSYAARRPRGRSFNATHCRRHQSAPERPHTDRFGAARGHRTIPRCKMREREREKELQSQRNTYTIEKKSTKQAETNGNKENRAGGFTLRSYLQILQYLHVDLREAVREFTPHYFRGLRAVRVSKHAGSRTDDVGTLDLDSGKKRRRKRDERWGKHREEI